jgi:hypothetical protein
MGAPIQVCGYPIEVWELPQRYVRAAIKVCVSSRRGMCVPHLSLRAPVEVCVLPLRSWSSRRGMCAPIEVSGAPRA